MLVLERVEKRYGSVSALDGLSLEVGAGELLAVLGPSGSGKSTALRVVAGLEPLDAGRVLVGGRDVTHVPPSQRDVAMVFQSFALFPHLTVRENIGFGLAARKTPPAERDRRVGEAAEVLGLGELLGRRPHALSGGERQRVALARALAGRPAVLLMDEPLSNLDAPLRERARTEIRRLHRETGATVVYVTHDQAEALSLGERVAVLDGGRLQQVGQPDEVYERPANSFVARFVGSPPMNLVEARVEDAVLRGPGPIILPLPEVAGVPPAGVRPEGSPRPGSSGALPPAGDRVLAGFRPEGATCPAPAGAPATFAARVDVVERAGHERLWYLTAGDARFAVRPVAGEHAAPGDEVAVVVDARAVRLFHPVTGEAR